MSHTTANPTQTTLVTQLAQLEKQIEQVLPHVTGTPDIKKLTILIRSEAKNKFQDTAIFFNADANAPVPDTLIKWLSDYLSYLQCSKMAIEKELEKKLS
jgi:hypothetical protein